MVNMSESGRTILWLLIKKKYTHSLTCRDLIDLIKQNNKIVCDVGASDRRHRRRFNNFICKLLSPLPNSNIKLFDEQKLTKHTPNEFNCIVQMNVLTLFCI